jgi:hypothetical protein
MSANRSVQAAQRRRAGPPDAGMPGGRPPQPSINSAQMFANQARPGTGPNMPNGRLAGQHAAKLQQDQYQHQQNPNEGGISSINKLTMTQAISLITLRLGAIESKLMHMDAAGDSNSGLENMNTGDLYDLSNRLDNIEKLVSQQQQEQQHTDSSSQQDDNVELTLLKQQFELLKQTVYQTKASTTNTLKENTLLKTQVELFKKELNKTNKLLASLQNLTLETNQKVLELSSSLNMFEPENEDSNSEEMLNMDDVPINIEDVPLNSDQTDIDDEELADNM